MDLKDKPAGTIGITHPDLKVEIAVVSRARPMPNRPPAPIRR
jgi:hypothetical protein